MTTTLEIPFAADFHSHLRQDEMMKTVVPMLKNGGISLAYVMPNLIPPITTTDQALEYKKQLENIEPNIHFIMTLYLNPNLTPAEIRKAHQAGIIGVKSYPQGVTTNSNAGIQVESYDIYYPIFEEMEKCGMVLNLHGECPSNSNKDINIFNAENAFLPILISLHKRFPRLRIVLEHATTEEAINTVKNLGDTIGCTITAHHLSLVIDDWAKDKHSYCKPVAKSYTDRKALREIVKSGHLRFFLGSDSAPHLRSAKEGNSAPAAGVFTSPFLLQLLAQVFDEMGALNQLANFACHNGRQFYNIKDKAYLSLKMMVLEKQVDSQMIPKSFPVVDTDNDVLVPWRAGSSLRWRLVSSNFN